MTELEEIRKKKLEELQQQAQSQIKEQVEMQQQLEMLETFIKQYLTKEAIQRFGTLKAAHPEKAVQVMAALAQAIRSGQIRDKINDEMLKSILWQLQNQKEFRIRK